MIHSVVNIDSGVVVWMVDVQFDGKYNGQVRIDNMINFKRSNLFDHINFTRFSYVTNNKIFGR